MIELRLSTTVENTFRSPNGNYSVPISYLVMQVVLTKLKEVDLVWSSVMLPIQRESYSVVSISR